MKISKITITESEQNQAVEEYLNKWFGLRVKVIGVARDYGSRHGGLQVDIGPLIPILEPNPVPTTDAVAVSTAPEVDGPPTTNQNPQGAETL